MTAPFFQGEGADSDFQVGQNHHETLILHLSIVFPYVGRNLPAWLATLTKLHLIKAPTEGPNWIVL